MTHTDQPILGVSYHPRRSIGLVSVDDWITDRYHFIRPDSVVVVLDGVNSQGRCSHATGIASARGQVLACLTVAAIRSAAATGSSCSHTRITVVVLDVMSSVRSALSARACQIRAETKGLGCLPPVAIQPSGPRVRPARPFTRRLGSILVHAPAALRTLTSSNSGLLDHQALTQAAVAGPRQAGMGVSERQLNNSLILTDIFI